jgi:hypothetical protein
MISCGESFKEIEPATIFGERRAHVRCSIELPIVFRVAGNGPVGQAGTGTVLNMSSSGIAFNTGDTIPCGCFVEFSIPWPYPGVQRTFVAYGRVVRKSGKLIAIHVLRHRLAQEDSSDAYRNPHLHSGASRAFSAN